MSSSEYSFTIRGATTNGTPSEVAELQSWAVEGDYLLATFDMQAQYSAVLLSTDFVVDEKNHWDLLRDVERVYGFYARESTAWVYLWGSWVVVDSLTFGS